ncbi:hypothetical protein fugu_013168 [Takifugu bimaculatus]|uniref:Complexin 2 n=1 Tax=Takifugu bimaculatus TaxID=433685 RepID=A0A4Z2C2L7_9TELE|nr:hypothetical protein fugu_013168 [Takifugu bimaculatus]
MNFVMKQALGGATKDMGKMLGGEEEKDPDAQKKEEERQEALRQQEEERKAKVCKNGGRERKHPTGDQRQVRHQEERGEGSGGSGCDGAGLRGQPHPPQEGGAHRLRR